MENLSTTELRIGNYYQDEYGNHHKIETLSKSLFADEHYDRGMLVKSMIPIPLTEELLLKCGFGYERAISSFTHPCMDMWLSLDYNSEKFIMYPTEEQTKGRQERLMNKFRKGEGLIPTAEAEYTMSNSRIKYLHQLQNLYFALVGEELNIK